MTIWQHLSIARVLLVLLLLAGFGVAWWMAQARGDAELRSLQLATAESRSYADLSRLSEMLTGLLLDPKSGPQGRRQHEANAAEDDLMTNLNFIQEHFKQTPEMANLATDARDYARRQFLPVFRRILSEVETDPTAALTNYNKNVAALSEQREELFTEFRRQAENAKAAEFGRSQSVFYSGLVGLALILGGCLLVVRRLESTALGQPLERLTGTMARMGRGDLSERLSLDQADEFGTLSHGMNKLSDELSELVGQVRRSGVQVNSSAGEIATVSRRQHSSVQEFTDKTGQLVALSGKISAGSKDMAKAMLGANQVAQDLAELAGSSERTIGHSEGRMRDIIEAAGSIGARLSVLREKSADINTALANIAKVADQTNLLSLNAAIEAEKAGEYGLGFAVVAMEIRRLADQTALATSEIEKMVSELQSAVVSGVTGMESFSESLRGSAEHIREISACIGRMNQQLQSFQPKFQIVSEGIEAQASSAEQISGSLVQLSESARQATESLRQSESVIERLNGAARGLETSVARFKLNNHS